VYRSNKSKISRDPRIEDGQSGSVVALSGGLENSWDRPVGGDDSTVECVTDKEFHAALCTKKDKKEVDSPKENSEKCAGSDDTDMSGVSSCPHFIIHSKCYCDTLCTVGVCTNCFVVFCNPSCLKDG
jgi:hypothetical protein